jgi:hypothetical protein
MTEPLTDCPNHGGSFDCTPFCELCAGEQELKLCLDCSGLGFDRKAEFYWKFPACQTCNGLGLRPAEIVAKKEKDYTLNAYADGFGVWHCEIFFTTPLGNTGEAERVAGNGLRAAKRLIRAEIAERMAGRPKRLSYYVKTNKTQPGSGRLLSLTIAEK